MPSIQPSPPSPLRRLAYEENIPLLGPDTDPDGWKCLNPFIVRGTVFNTRLVAVKCIVSLCVCGIQVGLFN
jgi:hypothetical protein